MSASDGDAAGSGGWYARLDPGSQQYYYHNVETGVTTWEKPEGVTPVVVGEDTVVAAQSHSNDAASDSDSDAGSDSDAESADDDADAGASSSAASSSAAPTFSSEQPQPGTAEYAAWWQSYMAYYSQMMAGHATADAADATSDSPSALDSLLDSIDAARSAEGRTGEIAAAVVDESLRSDSYVPPPPPPVHAAPPPAPVPAKAPAQKKRPAQDAAEMYAQYMARYAQALSGGKAAAGVVDGVQSGASAAFEGKRPAVDALVVADKQDEEDMFTDYSVRAAFNTRTNRMQAQVNDVSATAAAARQLNAFFDFDAWQAQMAATGGRPPPLKLTKKQKDKMIKKAKEKKEWKKKEWLLKEIV